jgi:hypothetical protein
MGPIWTLPAKGPGEGIRIGSKRRSVDQKDKLEAYATLLSGRSSDVSNAFFLGVSTARCGLNTGCKFVRQYAVSSLRLRGSTRRVALLRPTKAPGERASIGFQRVSVGLTHSTHTL